MEKASNNQIKLLRKLSQKKYREQTGLFLLEGERGIKQILDNGLVGVEHIFAEAGREDYFRRKFRNPVILEKKIFDEITDTESAQGIIAVCRKLETPSVTRIAEGMGVILALDRLQDPGNLGTILRTAAWFGVRAVIAGKGTTDAYSPKVVRSTAGAVAAVPVLYEDLDAALADLEAAGWDILLLDSDPAAEPIQMYTKSQKIVLVVGNEANGIDKKLMTENRRRILLPSVGKVTPVESLNAAMAAGIALYALADFEKRN